MLRSCVCLCLCRIHFNCHPLRGQNAEDREHTDGQRTPSDAVRSTRSAVCSNSATSTRSAIALCARAHCASVDCSTTLTAQRRTHLSVSLFPYLLNALQISYNEKFEFALFSLKSMIFLAERCACRKCQLCPRRAMSACIVCCPTPV